MDTTVGPAKPEAPRLREEGGLSSLPNFQGILRGKRRKGGKGKEEGKRKERKRVERGRGGGRERKKGREKKG